MLNGEQVTKEYFERSKYHIDIVWQRIRDKMVAGDLVFVANMMLSVNARFFNVLVKSQLDSQDGEWLRAALIKKVKKEFIELFERKLSWLGKKEH